MTGGHETRDVRTRPIVLTLLGLGVFLGAMHVGVHRLLDYYGERLARASAPASPLAATYGLQEPPAPRLQADPRRDLEVMRAEEAARLDGYAWVDREAGSVRIPIARAMDLVAERSRKK
jgi:hypothetical protein